MTHDICQNYFDGNTAEAARLQIACADLVDALFCEVNPIPVKTAMRRLGYNAGPLRMPLSEMEPANAAKLDAALRAHNLLKCCGRTLSSCAGLPRRGVFLLCGGSCECH